MSRRQQLQMLRKFHRSLVVHLATSYSSWCTLEFRFSINFAVFVSWKKQQLCQMTGNFAIRKMP